MNTHDMHFTGTLTKEHWTYCAQYYDVPFHKTSGYIIIIIVAKY